MGAAQNIVFVTGRGSFPRVATKFEIRAATEVCNRVAGAETKGGFDPHPYCDFRKLANRGSPDFGFLEFKTGSHF